MGFVPPFTLSPQPYVNIDPESPFPPLNLLMSCAGSSVAATRFHADQLPGGVRTPRPVYGTSLCFKPNGFEFLPLPLFRYLMGRGVSENQKLFPT